MLTESLFRALAEPTRLRILRLLEEMELAIGELAQVLDQSQPRVSRHVAILCDAGLVERRREGSWVFLRAKSSDQEGNPLAAAAARLLAIAEREDAAFGTQCAVDRKQLEAIRRGREDNAGAYFARHASDWDDLRKLHSPDEAVERTLIKAMADSPLGDLLDVGTGTGRMAELFAPRADRIVALDKSLEMLKLARAKLQHLPAERVELVQGDFTNLPFPAGRFSTVLLHQVLHFAHDPSRAINEAARVTGGGGRIVVIDFAAHEREELRERYAHVRLGFTDAMMTRMFRQAGFAERDTFDLHGGELVVKIWIGEKLQTSVRAADTKASA